MPKVIKEVNISVIGISGVEDIKGPRADEFHSEHCSVLSQNDFFGSPVINGDHWLYWGDRIIELSFDACVRVRVLEQTEFLDDESFEPLAKTSTSENYYQRCCRINLNSRDKLMYIQKEQLGAESTFPQQQLRDGKINVDGFIIVCDVSKNYESQLNQVLTIVEEIAKARKPTVVTFTKCDKAVERTKQLLLTLFLSTKGLRHVHMPPIETSSVENVNVDILFRSLCELCLGSCFTHHFNYHKASSLVQQQNLRVKNMYTQMLSQAIPGWCWADFKNFVFVFGSRAASLSYERHIEEVEKCWTPNRLGPLLIRLVTAFRALFNVDSIPEFHWKYAREAIGAHSLYTRFFDKPDYNSNIMNMELPEKKRIPADILLLPEAKNVFYKFRSFVDVTRELESSRPWSGLCADLFKNMSKNHSGENKDPSDVVACERLSLRETVFLLDSLISEGNIYTQPDKIKITSVLSQCSFKLQQAGAPLATPESIDFLPDYSVVKDAVEDHVTSYEDLSQEKRNYGEEQLTDEMNFINSQEIQPNASRHTQNPSASPSADSTPSESILSFIEKLATRSTQCSPRAIRKTRTPSSFNDTSEKISNVFNWLPSKTTKKIIQRKSFIHDLSNYSSSSGFQKKVSRNQTLDILSAESANGIPNYVELCIQFIEQNGGFEQEGIYRIPGNQAHLNELEKNYFLTGHFDVSSFDAPVHVVTTALKNFLSGLPEPLIPIEHHSRFKELKIFNDSTKNVKSVKTSISQLPQVNRTVLRYIILHLQKVACSTKTFMNSNNLAKVWSPTIFRPIFCTYEELSSGMPVFHTTLEILINNACLIFEE
ncbi:unnamed protein product [Caenorhabditis sp. 36 PRJEB53466]|nr:unnamed protein product [Caenorhabditis sp. 36 PRJEB53466]